MVAYLIIDFVELVIVAYFRAIFLFISISINASSAGKAGKRDDFF